MPPEASLHSRLHTRLGVPRIWCVGVPVLGLVFKPGTCGFKHRDALTENDGVIDLPFGLVATNHRDRRAEAWTIVASAAVRARRALLPLGSALDRAERRLLILEWEADERAHPTREGVPF